jgi:hypothetical protein
VPLARVSYSNLALAILAIMRRYGWTRFNAMCDTNRGDIQFLFMEVSCSILRSVFQATEISIVYALFDSENKEEIKSTLNRCKTLSSSKSLLSRTSSLTNYVFYGVLLINSHCVR